MKGYDNGMATRKAILNACKELFYEKGYRETTNEDICKKAHVIRSSIYYHFKDKEAIRYEVMWEYMIALRHLMENYCEENHSFSLSLYALWVRSISDEKLRKFFMDYHTDYPVFAQDSPTTQFYLLGYEQMYSRLWKKEDISPLSFASVYGYIVGMYQMMNAHPDAFNAKELFYNTMTNGMAIWGIPKDRIDGLWANLEACIDRIPPQVIQELPLYG